jgi:tripartite-type tricarboxylate transporter receptor subunit TctC
LFKTLAGIDITHVPYKDVGQAFIDIVTGRVQAYLGSPLRSLPFVRSGKMRALAVTSAKRLRTIPDWPTIAESGFPGYEAYNWHGLLVPAGTPARVIARLNREVLNIFKQPDVQEQMWADGAEIEASTPSHLAAFIASETRKWASVVKDSEAKVD